MASHSKPWGRILDGMARRTRRLDRLSEMVTLQVQGGEPRASLDMVAQSVLSPYAVNRKRQAAARHQGEHQGDGQGRGIGGAAPWQPPGDRAPLQRQLEPAPFDDPF
jgi:hypothetical protein